MTAEQLRSIVRLDRLIRALNDGQTKTAFQAAIEDLVKVTANGELSQVVEADRAGRLDVRHGVWREL